MFEEIKKVLSDELGIENEITKETRLREDLGIDSLLSVQLSVLLENKYNIDITEEELEDLKTINDVIVLLNKKGVKS